jgi:hypothetical protein
MENKRAGQIVRWRGMTLERYGEGGKQNQVGENKGLVILGF